MIGQERLDRLSLTPMILASGFAPPWRAAKESATLAEQGRAVDGEARAAFACAKLQEKASQAPAAKRRTPH